MSDQYHWKKENERDDLDCFLYAFTEVTGQSLAVVAAGEAPDFVCEKESGQRVGIELTKIIAHPETRQWHRLFGSGAMKLSADIGSEIFEAAFRKAKMLPKGRWKTFEMFLVIQLFDNPLSETYRGLEQIDGCDFAEFGFAEVWVADHSTLEAYNRVELFGIYPEQIAGYYALCAGRKPYG
jgi:hypothetical protein